MAALAFKLQKTDSVSAARAGKITTDNGIIETPIFMPVGTIGSVKSITQQHLEEQVKLRLF
jgi:queuine tRNA-ribosyltransferase